MVHLGSYERVTAAPLEHVYENALDWEHLPWLHSQDFSSVELYEAGDWGWQARVGWQPPERGTMEFELLLNRDAGAWVSRQIRDEPSWEVWTYAKPVKETRTHIDVQFHAPKRTQPYAEHFVKQYTTLYKRLWDQDEDMARSRFLRLTENLVRRKPRAATKKLGTVDELRARLPMLVDINDQRFRILEIKGELVVHSTLCAHLLGPLDDTQVADGCVTCPWHGYRFDVRSGESADGRGLRLGEAPELRIGAGEQVSLHMRTR